MKDDKFEGRKLTRDDLKVAIETIRRSGGDVISVSGVSGHDRDDDWCGTTGRFPFPPKPGVIDVLNLVGHGWVIDWFPYGIPVIDHVHVRLRDRTLVQRT
jgi:hypothetical protein